jgi:Type I phosphodiesterase / nucleotide pyrophosphatase
VELRGKRLGLRAVALVLALVVVGACTDDPPNQENGEKNESEPELATIENLIDTPGHIEPSPVDLVTEGPDNWLEAGCRLPFDILQRVRRGYYSDRSPDVIYVPREPNYRGNFPVATTHSGPWDYVQEVPFMFYGPGFIREQGPITLDREVTLADMSPTYAELMGTEFPEDRPGSPLEEVILPEAERNGTPKLIITVVWDGGGTNVLEAWPDSWPFLKSLIEKGTNVDSATVGSSPSVTPAIHATMGTGTFPRYHGIQNIPMRIEGRMTDSFPAGSPGYLETTTLADLYDQATGNVAKIGSFSFKFFHLGMIGHGAYLEGGDKDLAIVARTKPGDLATNTDYYYLPEYLQEVPGFERDIRAADLDDGKLDGKWFNEEDLTEVLEQRNTPAWVRYQTRIIKEAMAGEGFGDDDVTDLFYVNYKQLDDVGHLFNMLYPETRELLEANDAALKDLVSFLDEEVGEDEYVLALTADHGQTPTGLATGGWAIDLNNMQEDIAERFDVNFDDLYLSQQSVGFWLRPETMEANGITNEAVSNFLLDYTLDENRGEEEKIGPLFDKRRDELILSAAFPGERIPEIWECARERRAEGAG